MSLSASALKSKMVSAVSGKTEGDQAMVALGTAIGDYINANAEVEFSWVAFMPPPPSTKDPASTCKGKISGVKITLTQCGSSEYSVAMSKLASDIMMGVALGKYTTDASTGFVCSYGSLATAALGLSVAISGKDQDEAFSKLAGNIIDWITGLVPSIPVMGIHGAFTVGGIATPKSIS